MPEIHLRQPAYSACGPFKKKKKIIIKNTKI